MFSHRYFCLFVCILLICLITSPVVLCAQDVWSKPAFANDADVLRRAASDIKADKDAEATVLLSEYEITFDAAGKMVKKSHLIYRIETQDGVENWAEVRSNWEPWYQAKPEIRARVITSDGVVHWLDPKTLNDLPVHENQPDLYSDERAYGGPLPALAPGAIEEEEIVTRDTAPFFAGGTVERYFFRFGVPSNKTRFVISHPESLPLHYVLHLVPDATVNKSVTNSVETIVIEKGPLEASTDKRQFAPPDVVLSPMLEYSTGSSWQQVASEYFRNVNDKMRISDVQPLVSKLGLKSEANLESIRKIVAALHKNVRYTGVEFGESNLVPQFPGETLKRKYGDCKDKATLLVSMLGAAGIPARLALLSAGPGEDINPELPGMGGFDHAIVYVPATSSSPELWIDATAQYSLVGNLPTMDYGRWALIADEKTTGLKKIFELTSEKNRHIETREFVLADYGPAKIVEKNEQSGPTEEDYRDYYSGDTKKIRENSEKYIKDAYLADSLTSIDKTEPSDLDKPFVVTFTAKGRRGFTDIDTASVYVPQSEVFNGLPDYFYAKDDEEGKDESQESKSKPRSVDWLITPFVTEWHYKIMAPAGFKVRALPSDKEEHLGIALFTQKYSSSQDGSVVEAILRFDSGKARFTAEEGKALRDAIVKARAGDGIMIAFDQVGYSLLSAGKIKEALAADRQIVADHSKEALHRVRLARALLAAGLGEKARAVIKEAVTLDPKSAQAIGEQGRILEHDLIGRPRKKGFDYDSAIIALRTAKQLDPKGRAIRANLAMLLEYDSDGQRYSKKAHMAEAVAEFNELKKLSEDYARSYEDYVPYDLWYLGECKELNEYIAALPASETRRAFTLACAAISDGADAAIKKSLEIASNEQDRSKALATAGWLLVRIRRYPEAGELLLAGARGQSNETQIVPYATILKKTKRMEELNIDPLSPTSVVYELFRLTFAGKLGPESIEPFTSKSVRESPGFRDENDKTKAAQTMFELRAAADKSGMPVVALGDITLSSGRFSVEGDDSLGYAVTMEIGGLSQKAFVVREDGRFKLVEFIEAGRKIPENMGWEILSRLQRNDLAGARKWLDWAREKVHIDAGDDPLSGQPFPHFWSKGQAGDESAIRAAALILVPSKYLKGQNLAALVEARNNAKTDSARAELNLVLAHAYAAQEQSTELLSVAEELVKAFPDSFTAFQFVTRAYANLKRLDDWDKLVQSQLQKHPDEPEYVRSAADLARYRGDLSKARTLLKGLIDHGKAIESDFNAYVWDALFITDKIDQDAIEAGERGDEISHHASFPMMHTLACVYAQAGRTKEARDLLLKAMEAAKMEEPNSEVWFGLGEIAEQYGETEAARGMYSKVEKPKSFHPAETYILAQQRLAALQNAGVTAKAAGQ
ncbi:MAG TPA: DUF3857 domain-containing protein [Candidatus Angelobacter sp.]